jgi:hypothetical protein
MSLLLLHWMTSFRVEPACRFTASARTHRMRAPLSRFASLSQTTNANTSTPHSSVQHSSILRILFLYLSLSLSLCLSLSLSLPPLSPLLPSVSLLLLPLVLLEISSVSGGIRSFLMVSFSVCWWRASVVLLTRCSVVQWLCRAVSGAE